VEKANSVQLVSTCAPPPVDTERKARCRAALMGRPRGTTAIGRRKRLSLRNRILFSPRAAMWVARDIAMQKSLFARIDLGSAID